MTGTWQTRNTAAALPALAPIDATALVLKPRTYGFAALESSTMGTLGTDKDGWDGKANPLLAAIATESNGLKVLDAAMASAAFTRGAMSKSLYSPVVQDIADLTPTGDHQSCDLAQWLASGTPAGGTTCGGTTGTPTPTPPPTKPSPPPTKPPTYGGQPTPGGGGGASGGGGTPGSYPPRPEFVAVAAKVAPPKLIPHPSQKTASTR